MDGLFLPVCKETWQKGSVKAVKSISAAITTRDVATTIQRSQITTIGLIFSPFFRGFVLLKALLEPSVANRYYV